MTPDPYEVLGIPRDASPKDIRSAYRQLAMKHHPDKNPGDVASAWIFRQISWAYKCLQEEEEHQSYGPARPTAHEEERTRTEARNQGQRAQQDRQERQERTRQSGSQEGQEEQYTRDQRHGRTRQGGSQEGGKPHETEPVAPPRWAWALAVVCTGIVFALMILDGIEQARSRQTRLPADNGRSGVSENGTPAGVAGDETRQPGSPPEVEYLKSIAAEVNSRAPVMIDQYTELSGAMAWEDTLQYVYRLLLPASELDRQTLNDIHAELELEVRNGACTTPGTRDSLLDRGANMRFVYYSQEKRYLFAISVRGEDCGQ